VSASTLCLLHYPINNNVAEDWGKLNFDTDSQGNLYVPDTENNRILRYNTPLKPGQIDNIPDFVWGQNDFNSNGPNRGPLFPIYSGNVFQSHQKRDYQLIGATLITFVDFILPRILYYAYRVLLTR
jgi:hypothetical protein